MDFEVYTKNFLASYRGPIDLRAVATAIRSLLQFNDAPSLMLMKEGEVDCVGASAIAMEIFKVLWPQFEFWIVSLPRLPWLDTRIASSRHCCVVKKDDSGFQFIDVTPINGYGYGVISQIIPFSCWSFEEENASWYLKELMESDDLDYWEKHLYPIFVKLSCKDVASILRITDARHRLRSGESVVIDFPPPSKSIGWKREYWRTAARVAVANGSSTIADAHYCDALQISPCDFYLLKEYMQFLQSTSLSNHNCECNEQRLLSLQEDLLVSNVEILQSWDEAVIRAYQQQDWYKYYYYLGAAFWRRQSQSLIANQEPAKIDMVNFDGSNVPLYRFTPAWFSKRNFGVAVVKGRINNPNQIVAQRPLLRPLVNIENISGLVGLSADVECSLCIIRKDELMDGSVIDQTFDAEQAHLWFVGISNPELYVA
ncbi:MAG: hypothetical protein NT007_13450 [Candidatus Kapabacteria bacterium]|nr:hypothetical protein [Candidatus Kapabacteria bacterium]